MDLFEGVQIGLNQDSQLLKIFHWLTGQAEAGNPKAMTNLGVMYAMGLGIPFDTSLSFHWFQQAAMHEDLAGIHNSGRAYEKAEGVHFNPDAALVHYKQAARLGFIPSMLALVNWISASPYHTEKDVFEACKAPAALHNPEALYRLGLCYRNGTGTTRNTRKGIMLLTQSAELDYLPAQATLRDYYCYKPADRPTRVWRPRMASDEEMAIIWNFVAQTLHGLDDGLAHFLLPRATKIGLAYPFSGCDLGHRKVCNDIFRAIHAYQAEQRTLFVESRRWAEESGIKSLYPESVQDSPSTTDPHLAVINQLKKGK